MIDGTGHARLTDFGLLTIMSDCSHQLSSSSGPQSHGTLRWTSPELIDPPRFGSANGRPTISSDCYALGMVVYEVIGGRPPFHELPNLSACSRILEGHRPPRDADFADILWEMLQLCWMAQPSDRPNIEDVLQCLERVWESSKPPESVDGTTTTEVPTTEEDADDLKFSNRSPGKFSHFAYHNAS